MIEILIQLGVFLAKTTIIVLAILLVLLGIFSLFNFGKGDKNKEHLIIKKLNDYYEELAETLYSEILNKSDYKKREKEQKQRKKAEEKQTRSRIFVLTFDGDLRASEVESLRTEITAILNVATIKDEVVVKLESGGGFIQDYGLAGSQLQRIKDRQIPLTLIVDKVAASGGYMMACIADQIIAAPFAVIGSIGVIAQLPNFHRLLKKHDIDFEQIKAGEYKRTLTLFGENTREGRQKFQEEIDEAHQLFKDFVKQHRPVVDIDTLATGEHWYGLQALERHLIDRISTSDDYLLAASKTSDLYEITYEERKKWYDKIIGSISMGIKKGMSWLSA